MLFGDVSSHPCCNKLLFWGFLEVVSWSFKSLVNFALSFNLPGRNCVDVHLKKLCSSILCLYKFHVFFAGYGDMGLWLNLLSCYNILSCMVLQGLGLLWGLGVRGSDCSKNDILVLICFMQLAAKKGQFGVNCSIICHLIGILVQRRSSKVHCWNWPAPGTTFISNRCHLLGKIYIVHHASVCLSYLIIYNKYLILRVFLNWVQ